MCVCVRARALCTRRAIHVVALMVGIFLCFSCCTYRLLIWSAEFKYFFGGFFCNVLEGFEDAG